MRRTGTPGSPHRFPQEALRSTRSPYPLRIDTRGSRWRPALAGVQKFAHPVVLLGLNTIFSLANGSNLLGDPPPYRQALKSALDEEQEKAPLVERGFRMKGF